jgi:phospholipase/carboxylesterase
MNRIQPPANAPQVGSFTRPWDMSSGRFAAVSHDLPHVLFAPEHYEPNYAYPLLVWLHGPAADERQLLRIIPLVSLRNYVAVAPRAVSVGIPGKLGKRRPQWFCAADVAARADQRVLESIALAQSKYHISPKRVFVAGFDSGGTMAFHLAMNYPRQFAGALSFGGAFPVGHKPFRRLDEARGLAVFLAAGRDSACYPPTKVCDDLRLLHSAGLSITLRQYPCGHELCPQMLRDMDRWVIEQITNESD